MYIIELISKLYTKIKNGGFKFTKKRKEAVENEDEYSQCEHILIPIDSSKEILACSKCGFIVKTEKLKTKSDNPFKKFLP